MLLHNKEHKDQKDLAKNNSEQTKICLEKQIRKAQRKVNNTETLHLNPGGTQEVRASIPTQEYLVLTQIQARITQISHKINTNEHLELGHNSPKKRKRNLS